LLLQCFLYTARSELSGALRIRDTMCLWWQAAHMCNSGKGESAQLQETYHSLACTST
jgi:hypothetical protein